MERIIGTALVLFGVLAWMYRKYGLLSLATKKFPKHAGVGRAKHKLFWNVPVRDHRQRVYSAADLIASLRAERIAYGLAA